MPLSEGMLLKNCSNASSPPADAPMPTMGKETFVSRAETPFSLLVGVRAFVTLEAVCFLRTPSDFFLGILVPPNYAAETLSYWS
ncbi:MAG: hypothetical protein ACLQPD_16985 [Desulfomonilaceae bacterium]